MFILAHLSDPHLPPMPVLSSRQFAGKRALGYLNWTRNRHRFHRREIADALAADVLSQRPDHIALTGDIVNLALPQEFPPARRWVEQLGEPRDVSVVPGNHDVYMRDTEHRFDEVFADYGRGDDGVALYPYLRRRGPVLIVGVSTAAPTPPFMATGRLGARQLSALDALLASIEGDGGFRVLLIHHPLRSHAQHKRLTDAAELLALLARHRVDLVLHGHDHVHSTIFVNGPGTPIPVVGVPSASNAGEPHRPPAGYNLFSISKDADGWRCRHTIRGLQPDGSFAQIAETTLAPRPA